MRNGFDISDVSRISEYRCFRPEYQSIIDYHILSFCAQSEYQKDQGSRIKDQGSRIKDQGSRVKDHSFEYSEKFRECLLVIKIGAKFDEKHFVKRIFAEFNAKIRKSFTKVCPNLEIGAVQRIANLVVLEKC